MGCFFANPAILKYLGRLQDPWLCVTRLPWFYLFGNRANVFYLFILSSTCEELNVIRVTKAPFDLSDKKNAGSRYP